jgi:hypothetical protein
MASLLKPELSVPVAAALSTLVYGIYSQATPSIADIRVGRQNDANIESSRKGAAWAAAGSVAAISLITKDPTVFVVGGGMVILMDWWTRHANAVDPATGTASSVGSAPTSPMAPAPIDGGDVQFAFAETAGTF